MKTILETQQMHCHSVKMERLLPILFKVGMGMIGMMVLSTMAAAQQVPVVRFDPVRLNCGGGRYRDPVTSFVWKGDSSTYVTTGYKTSKCHNRFVSFTNTTRSMREIYCSNRFFKPTNPMKLYNYNIPVLNTTDSYIVRLHFGEMVCGGSF